MLHLTNRDTTIGRGFLDLIVRRQTLTEDNGLMPSGFVVDWNDEPLRHKLYPGLARIALPARLDVPHAALGDIMSRPEPSMSSQRVTTRAIAALLGMTNGVLRRKLEIEWTLGADPRFEHASARYSRAPASAGGLYPIELYLVVGPGQELPAGVYHYSSAHHALDVLHRGDVTAVVRTAALHHPLVLRSDVFVMAAADFWKTCFKYSSFGYHALTQDLGASLAMLRQSAKALGLGLGLVHWFRDEQVNRALGLDGERESVMAIAPIGTRSDPQPPVSHALESPLFPERRYERSRRVQLPPRVRALHRASLVHDEPRPHLPPRTLPPPVATGPVVKLPSPVPLHRDLMDTLAHRASSMGRLRSTPKLRLDHLASVLRHAVRGRDYPCDLSGPAGAPFIRLVLFAQHVEELPDGIYSHDHECNGLELVRRGSHAHELQGFNPATQYNWEQAAAVLVVVARLPAALEAYGNRAVRIVNADVGMLVQHVYLACAALGVGAGANLGFPNARVDALLGLDTAVESSLMLIPIGNQGPDINAFHSPLLFS